ncbi:hypothetical protein MRX96_031335 [Rhipicephalus microplus]
MCTSPTVGLQYKNTYRKRAEGGPNEGGRNRSAINTGTLPSQALPQISVGAEDQATSVAFNALGHNVRPANEQEILIDPKAVVTDMPVHDPQANLTKALSEAVRTALNAFPETQSGHIIGPRRQVSPAESSQADQLLAFIRAQEGASTLPTTHQSNPRTSKPDSPNVKKKYDLTLQEAAHPSAAHQEQNVPSRFLFPSLPSKELGMLSTSPYHSSTSAQNLPMLFFPGQVNQLRYPHCGNIVPPPVIQQPVSQLLQGTSFVPRDVRQQPKPDVGPTVQFQNSMTGMLIPSLYTFPYFGALGLHPTTPGNQFGQQCMPPYSAASSRNVMCLAPQTMFHTHPFQRVAQEDVTQQSCNLTTPSEVAPPWDRRTDPQATQYAVHCPASSSAPHLILQPTVQPHLLHVQKRMLFALRPPHHPVCSEQPVSDPVKMAYVQKWVDDCARKHHQKMPHPSQALMRRQRSARTRKCPRKGHSRTVPQNEDTQRDVEADSTDATMATLNSGQTSSPEVRSQKTSPSILGRRRGRKGRGRRGAPQVESHLTELDDPEDSQMSVPMESFLAQQGRESSKFYGQNSASTSRSDSSNKCESTTYRSALYPSEITSQTPDSGSSQPVSRRQSTPGQTSSSTSQTETLNLTPTAQQVAQREEGGKREEVRRVFQSSLRDPQRDADSGLPNNVDRERHWDTAKEARLMHSSEPSKEGSLTKRPSQAIARTPRRRKGIPRKRWPTRHVESALEDYESRLIAEGETSSLGQNHRVPETDVLRPEQREDVVESSSKKGIARSVNH